MTLSSLFPSLSLSLLFFGSGNIPLWQGGYKLWDLLLSSPWVAWGKSFLGVFLFLNGSLTFTAKYQKQGEERNKWGNSFLKGGRKSCYSCSLTRIFLDVRGNSLTKAGRYRQARWQWRAWDSPEGVWAMSSLSRDLVILPQGGFFFMSISVPFFQYREL